MLLEKFTWCYLIMLVNSKLVTLKMLLNKFALKNTYRSTYQLYSFDYLYKSIKHCNSL